MQKKKISIFPYEYKNKHAREESILERYYIKTDSSLYHVHKTINISV